MKKIVLSVFAILTLLASCSKDESMEASQEVFDDTPQAMYERVNNTIIKEFAIKHIDLSLQILTLLDESESNLSFTDNSYSEILRLQSENEVRNYFAQKGLNNSEEFINLLKSLQENFLSVSNELKNLTIAEQEQIIGDAINEELDNTMAIESGRDCRSQWRIDIQRCARNQVIGLAFSFVGGVLTGGVGGWLGAAASTTAYHFCMEDAGADWRACSGWN
jgi:hypothetical protein